MGAVVNFFGFKVLPMAKVGVGRQEEVEGPHISPFDGGGMRGEKGCISFPHLTGEARGGGGSSFSPLVPFIHVFLSPLAPSLPSGGELRVRPPTERPAIRAGPPRGVGMCVGGGSVKKGLCSDGSTGLGSCQHRG